MPYDTMSNVPSGSSEAFTTIEEIKKTISNIRSQITSVCVDCLDVGSERKEANTHLQGELNIILGMLKDLSKSIKI